MTTRKAKAYVAFEVARFSLGSMAYRINLLLQLPSAGDRLLLEPSNTSIVLRRQALTDGSQRCLIQMMYPAVDVLKSGVALGLTWCTLPAAAQQYV